MISVLGFGLRAPNGFRVGGRCAGFRAAVGFYDGETTASNENIVMLLFGE